MIKKIAFFCLCAALAVSSWAGSEPQLDLQSLLAKITAKDDGLIVMTRNIYIGANVDTILEAEDPTQVPLLAAEAYQVMMSTNFPERAQALAEEIAWAKPHLVGIQEAWTIRMQLEGDSVFGGTVPAEKVVFNYLKILRNAMASLGLKYRVVAIIQDADVEMPMINPASPIGISDVRVTDHDVIMVREDVEIVGKLKGSFVNRLIVPSIGIEVPRGYVGVDAKVNGRTYRFVNTHLEPASIPELVPLQLAQAQELLAAVISQEYPVIIVGDFNSPAKGGETYQFISSQGYVDSWRRNLLREFLTYNKLGNTDSHDDDLRNERVHLKKRIDLIFVQSQVSVGGYQDIGPVIAFVVGDELEDRTPSGLWPSDHAGVVAKIWIPQN